MIKLSEAIILGDTLGTRSENYWLEKDEGGGYTGCAIGRASLAVGVDVSDVPYMQKESVALSPWPWITHDQAVTMSNKFRDVCNGYTTLEEFVEFVRSIEPAEEARCAPIHEQVEVLI